QLVGEEPGEVPRQLHDEVDQLLLVGFGDVLDQVDEGRDLAQLREDGRHQAGEERVDLVEVVVEAVEAFQGAGDLGSGNSQVVVDMGVHAGEEVLQDDQGRVRHGVEGHLPAGGDRGIAGPPLVEGGQITAGEGDVEHLHALVVVEVAGADAGAHRPRNPPVERGEISGAAAVGGAPGDDLVHLRED